MRSVQNQEDAYKICSIVMNVLEMFEGFKRKCLQKAGRVYAVEVEFRSFKVVEFRKEQYKEGRFASCSSVNQFPETV